MNVQSVAMSGKKIVAHMRESLGILLKKGLIFPILIQRRKAHTEIVGFSIVATCQMVVFARTTPSFGGRTSGIFYSKTKGGAYGIINKKKRKVVFSYSLASKWQEEGNPNSFKNNLINGSQNTAEIG